jgi:hypothetical protein
MVPFGHLVCSKNALLRSLEQSVKVFFVLKVEAEQLCDGQAVRYFLQLPSPLGNNPADNRNRPSIAGSNYLAFKRSLAPHFVYSILGPRMRQRDTNRMIIHLYSELKSSDHLSKLLTYLLNYSEFCGWLFSFQMCTLVLRLTRKNERKNNEEEVRLLKVVQIFCIFVRRHFVFKTSKHLSFLSQEDENILQLILQADDTEIISNSV